MQTVKDAKICVVGLGYVGLPLAVEFSKHFPTIGFDISHSRIAGLKKGTDSTLEVGDDELAAAKALSFTSEIRDVSGCNVYIITVPTPIDEAKRPDLSASNTCTLPPGSGRSPKGVVSLRSS